MPKGDRTGPMGSGAMSGRGAGYCSGFDMPGYADSSASAGLLIRMGRRCGGWGGPSAGGRGWRHWSFAAGRKGRMFFGRHASAARPFNAEVEKESLRKKSLALQSELESVNQRMAEIDSQDKAP